MRRGKTLNTQKKRLMLLLYMVFLLLCSIGILLMPLAMQFRTQFRGMSVITSALFWLGGIGCIIIEIYISNKRRRDKNFCSEHRKTPKYGVIRFCKNKAAIAADVTAVFSLAGGIISYIASSPRVFYAFLAVFVFSFGMHSMLNGINFIYIKYSSRSKRKS